MSKRNIHNDFGDLLFTAERALNSALQDGEKKGYGPGHWKTVGVANHLDHACWHASHPKPSTKDIEHAVCRLLMAYALMIGEKGEER